MTGPKHLSISIEKAAPIIAYLARPENAWKNNKHIARELGTIELQVRRAKFKYRWGLTMKIAIKRIRRDAGLQPRAELVSETVTEYAESMKAGKPFPPPTVYYDGVSYWLADGFHRVAAALQAGIKSIHVEVKMGEKRDAKLFAAGANAEHGLKRSNADKRRAVLSLLSDEEWWAKSDDWVAAKCHVSSVYVGTIRRVISRENGNVSVPATRKCADGSTRTYSPPKPKQVAPVEQEQLAEFVDETNGIYRDAEPEDEPAAYQDEPSTNGHHEPEAVAVATEDGRDDEPETTDEMPWPLTLGTQHLGTMILRYFSSRAVESFLRDLAARAGYSLVPSNKG